MSELLKPDSQQIMKKFNENFLHYVTKYNELKERHKGKFIAIENGSVTDEDSNVSELIHRLEKKGDFRHIFIQYINEQNNIFRI